MISLQQLLKTVVKQNATDLHLVAGSPPALRIDGKIVRVKSNELSAEEVQSLCYSVITDEQKARFETHRELDFSFGIKNTARFRGNLLYQRGVVSGIFRRIPIEIPDLETLQLPSVINEVATFPNGLVLVCGPTGSGKSTTMAAMIDYINKEMAKHIITIEDPIEFVHQSRKSLIKQREVGMHTLKFDNALKAALREDPDLILVGEMRDKETVNTALKAAQTGHLVMGTLHTNSAVKTIERILNLYSAEEQHSMRVALSESLVCVVAQGLCKTTDGKRAAFHDILINTESVKEYIKEGQYDEITTIMNRSEFDGMTTMNKALLKLYQEGRITEEIALEMSPTPNEMAQFLRGRV